uniref:Uncharacterized protein n=1 Tax=Physcomitrium patens TaxID=3218 RepID=A0A7I4DNJ0_PHYPA
MRTVNPRTHLYYDSKTRRWSAYVREPWVGGKRLYLAASRHQKLQQCFHFSCGKCQDRAKLKLEAELTHMPLAELACKQLTPTRLIYPREDYEQDKGGKRDSLSRKQFFAYLVHESRGTYQQYEPSPCLVKFLAEEPTLGTVGSSSSALELDEEKNRSQSSLSTNSGELRNMTSEQAPLSMSLQLPKLASERGPSFRRGMKREGIPRPMLGKRGAAEVLVSIMHSNDGFSMEEADRIRTRNY